MEEYNNILSLTGTVVAKECTSLGQPDLHMCVPSGVKYCPGGKKFFPGVHSQTNSGQELGATGGVSEIESNRIKRIEMKSNVKRLKSFPCCHDHVKDLRELAQAGFYCAGQGGDCVRCFYCGGGLRDWLPEDDVWVEHAKWFPECGYVMKQMGKDFITVVQFFKAIKEQVSLQEVENVLDELLIQKKCSSCNQQEIVVTYYPCGHMTCYYCAHRDRARPCHICGRAVLRRIPTRL